MIEHENTGFIWLIICCLLITPLLFTGPYCCLASKPFWLLPLMSLSTDVQPKRHFGEQPITVTLSNGYRRVRKSLILPMIFCWVHSTVTHRNANDYLYSAHFLCERISLFFLQMSEWIVKNNLCCVFNGLNLWSPFRRNLHVAALDKANNTRFSLLGGHQSLCGLRLIYN